MKMTVAFLGVMISIGYSQIGSIKITEAKKEKVYDSTENFLFESPDMYMGAKLFLPGKSVGLQEYGYDNFKTKKNSDYLKNVYKCCSEKSKFNSNYSLLAGTTFDVVAVEKKEDSYSGEEYVLTLKNLQDRSTAYFSFDTKYEHTFPFIDMRFFEKLKGNTLNRSYVVKENSFNLGQKIADINDVVIDSVWKYDWKCVDVLIEEKYFTLALLLRNKFGREMVFHAEDVRDEQFIISSERAAIYKSRFKTFWKTILQNKVAIGMSEEMVRISWGDPKDMNKTIVSGTVTNQWIYKSGNYVYFRNGVVTAIQ